jgi:hypothetical protein
VVDAFQGVESCDDVAPAHWVLTALRPWTRGRLLPISSLVPSDYPAHGRIFHRAWEATRPIRWREIAARTGQTLSAAVRYNDLVGWHPGTAQQSPPEPWSPPNSGSLLEEECAAVAEVLARHTTTPDEC